MSVENNTIPQPQFILPDTGYIRIKEVLKVIPVSKSTWWNGVKSGHFPKSVKLGERTTAWHVDDIKSCIEKFKNKKS